MRNEHSSAASRRDNCELLAKAKDPTPMPWTPKQHRLFEAVAHDPAIAKSTGIPRAKAAAMASEGIKTSKQSITGKASALGGANSPRPLKLRSLKSTGLINSRL